MHRFSLLFALVLLPGCPICSDGELVVLEGSRPVDPGASVQFEFRYDGETYSTPGACGGHWYVNGVEGGTDATGRITGCGRYTAPLTPPSEPPLIQATQYPADSCLDCCPYASIYLAMAGGAHLAKGEPK